MHRIVSGLSYTLDEKHKHSSNLPRAGIPKMFVSFSFSPFQKKKKIHALTLLRPFFLTLYFNILRNILSETMFSNAYGAIDNFSFCFLFQNVKHTSCNTYDDGSFLFFWSKLGPCSPSNKLRPCVQRGHMCHALAIGGIISPVGSVWQG